MATLTARVEDWLGEEIREFWQEHGMGPSAGYRQVVEEWWTLQRFPLLEFRDGVSGRRAGLRSGPDVWEIIMVARDYGNDLAAVAEHFGGLLGDGALEQALAYGERFPGRIEERIAENTRIERLLNRRASR